MNKTFRRSILLLVALALIALVPAAFGQDVITDDEVNEVAKDLYCPVCENTPLDVCPTQACRDWREVIRTKLATGESKAQIMDYFQLQYGDHVLAEPPRSGFDLIVWILPVVGLVAGSFFFARYLNRIRSQEPAALEAETASQEAPPPAADDYVARIERELRDSS